jgi:dihydrofolate reductase/thymidylate synthase
MQYDLNEGFPILTIRKSAPKWIIREFLWFISGSTNVKQLQDQKISIWDHNSSREFLDEIGLSNLKTGDIGAGYGFQLRHAGTNYIDCETEYKDGIDQLQICTDLIKNDPNNRRILINLWNVADLKKMALPPCHLLYQFTVTEGKLNIHLYQRSWDINLGWNYATAALFCHLLAHYCDLQVGILTHTICDCHLYVKHLEYVKEFIDRPMHKLPTFKIIGEKPEKVDNYTNQQFVIQNYQAGEKVLMQIQ